VGLPDSETHASSLLLGEVWGVLLGTLGDVLLFRSQEELDVAVARAVVCN
jgi:hypothetical protein